MELYDRQTIDREILEETDEDFKQILMNVKEINSLIDTIDHSVNQQGEMIKQVEQQTEDAEENIADGNKDLKIINDYKFSKKKKLLTIGGGAVTGGIVGICAGGFFGIIPGIIAGGICAGVGAGAGAAVNKFKK